MIPHESEYERIEELLVTRAIEGLEPTDDAELERLLAASEDADPDLFDEAAAWFLIGSAPESRPLPDALAQRIVERIESRPDGTPDSSVVPLQSRRRPTVQNAGWLAAAAALILAIAGWWPQMQDPDPTGPTRPAAARDRLVANAPDLVRVDWTNTEHPRAQQLAGGYVVWSDELQRGYMTFRRMPDNDPDRHQYQLWVFDAARPEQYPVDGGVFDAGAEGDEVVVPIDTKLPVQQATLFAVTLEPPGGVVVSDRDPILWLAQPSSDTTS